MKFISAFVLSLATYVGLSASVPVQLDRRSNVNCQGMYRGSLYASDLDDLHPNGFTTSNQNKETWRGFTIVTGSNDFLVLGDEPLTWQFDACQTDGWNNDFQDLGQLKLISSGFYNAVTADKNVTEFSNDGHALRIRPAFDANYGRLDRQWFRAYWTEDSQGEPYVALTLSGNPNDNNEEYSLPKIGFSGGDVDNKVLAESNWSTVSFTLALFDLEYL